MDHSKLMEQCWFDFEKSLITCLLFVSSAGARTDNSD